MENNQNEIPEVAVVTPAKEKTLGEMLKEQSANIALGVATLALTAWGAYDNYKRQNRKEQKYNEYLDAKLDKLEDSVGAYKDSLFGDRPEDPKELKD